MVSSVRVEGENLVIELHEVDRVLAFKRSLAVKLEHIASVSTDEVPWVNLHELRITGASIPGVVRDGHFVSNDGWVFYEMHDPTKCVTLTLSDEEYKKVVFQVDDKEATATTIRNAVAERAHSSRMS